MPQSTDIIVLGAGIVGVSAALHLQARGRGVALLDRRGAAGRETSYGNAGLIERSSVHPYMFPLGVADILRHMGNRSAEARYHLNALPQLLPWLWQYACNSRKIPAARIARDALPLIERCVTEHEALATEAGAAHLLRRTGWIKLFRTPKALEEGAADAAALAAAGLTSQVLDARELAALEPNLQGGLGAVRHRDPVFVPDPGALSLAYAALFSARGGRLLAGDAASLAQTDRGWRVAGAAGPLEAREVVVALGPWANTVLGPLGYRVPLEIKRGYHMHYGATGNAVLNHPVLDAERGYLLAPMDQGIRLTTGVEFARFDAPPTPVQLAQVEPEARKLFPLGERRDPAPWMGRRPCLPDMLPVIGRAPRHKGLWLNFGHHHHGLTLGPACGRLLAEMMTGEETFADPAPYRLQRFG